MNNLMQREDVKKPLRKILLLAVIAVACWSVVICPSSSAGFGRDLDKRANDYGPTANNDERNIEKMAVKRVQPPYPALAQKYKIEGMVTVHLTVGDNGKVTKAEFVRGHNIFRSVSLDAAKRWEFKTSGEKSLEGTIRFSFKLND